MITCFKTHRCALLKVFVGAKIKRFHTFSEVEKVSLTSSEVISVRANVYEIGVMVSSLGTDEFDKRQVKTAVTKPPNFSCIYAFKNKVCTTKGIIQR